MGFFEWLGQTKEILFGYLLVALIAIQIGKAIVNGPPILLKAFLVIFGLAVMFSILRDFHK